MDHVNTFLWVEKYRPKKISDCVLPAHMKDYFQKIVDSGEVQNMLLVGSPGTGKTTVAKALCNELNLDYMFINASENGNIGTLRDEIRGYASSVSIDGGIKVVILDEADALTNATQPALRGFIEEFANNCRFIFTANYANKIIDPLKSRLAVTTFALSKEEKTTLAMQFNKRLKEILAFEGVEFEDKTLAQLVIKFFPDFRKVLNELQRNTTGGQLKNTVLSVMSDDSIKQLMGHLKKTEWSEMRKWVVDNQDNDFNIIQRAFYEKLADYVTPASIPQAVLTLAEYDYKSAFVMDKEINTVAMFTELMRDLEFK